MKKIIFTLTLLCALSAGAFGQTMLDLRQYFSYFPIKANENISDNNYVWLPNDDDYERFSVLSGRNNLIDTPLEFALLSYYSQPVLNIRPAQANAILPANNPRLADQKLGAAVFQEIQILRFLGDTAAVNRHEAVLQYITGRGNATRAEIETFYRNNIRGLIEGVVDRDLNTRSPINNDTRRVAHEIITTPLTNFYLTPTQANFDRIKTNIRIRDEINSFNGFDAKSVSGVANLTQYGEQGRFTYDLVTSGIFLLNGIDHALSSIETFERVNRNIGQILRQVVNEARNWQSRMVSQRFGINNISNVELNKTSWWLPINLLNRELANRLLSETR